MLSGRVLDLRPRGCRFEPHVINDVELFRKFLTLSNRDVRFGNANSIYNSLFTIAIVFRHGDFHLRIVWLDTKRKLNGNRIFMLLPTMHFSKISGL